MAFDGAFLRLISKEIEEKAIGARVDKIYQPAKNLFVFFLRSKDFNGKLMLCAEGGNARLQLTKAEFENPATPPMLCMLFRKKLVGAKLVGLRQPGLERLVHLDFDTKNELGDPIRLTVVLEAMGRNANLILCEENGRVIDAVRRTDASDTTRILMPGVTYLPPPRQSDTDLLCPDISYMLAPLALCERRNLAKELLTAAAGISPLVCREIAFRALDPDMAEDEPLSEQELNRLTDEITRLQNLVQSESGTPTMIIDPTGKPLEFTFFAPRQYEGEVSMVTFDHYSELLDAYYIGREKKARMQAKTQQLTKVLNTTVARLARTINVRTEELKKAQNSEQLRKWGELLKANLGQIPSGANRCTVVDYYDPECNTIQIPLSPALSPAQNAQKYFKEYRKQCTAAGLLTGLIEKGKQDMEYLLSVKEALDRAQSDGEVAAITEELQDGGYLKQPRGNKKKPSAKPLPPHTFVSIDGFVILAGRNNRQNDTLTLRQAAGNDIWFHTKAEAGAHVIVKSEGKPVPDTTLTQAAVIAATLSGAKESSGVAVDYCPAKRVKKPAGAPPGKVIYENYSTAYVDPDFNLLETLKNQHNGGIK